MNPLHLGVSIAASPSTLGGVRITAMRSVRTWTVGSTIAGLVLLSPVVAFLTVISAEVAHQVGPSETWMPQVSWPPGAATNAIREAPVARPRAASPNKSRRVGSEPSPIRLPPSGSRAVIV